MTPPEIDAGRVIEDLRGLAGSTSDGSGAQRVAWTQTWELARDFVARLLRELGLDVESDEAGNRWAYLPGRRPEVVAIGSHIDSVPNGGRLDGALGVMAAIGVVRALVAAGIEPESTVAVVDFADEEGSRFGRSLFGSSAVAGSLDPARLRGLHDADGVGIEEAMGGYGVDLDLAPRAAARREGVVAFLELHVEQGPVLEAAGLGVGAVEGAMGIDRRRCRVLGQIGHAGATPMARRRDPLVASAAAITECVALAEAAGGLATAGELRLDPNIPTAVPRSVEFTIDLRHAEPEALAGMATQIYEATDRAVTGKGCSLEIEPIWESAPVRFDPALVRIARRHASRVSGGDLTLVSGPGHDAVALAEVLPSAMLFASSINGVSHAPEEDTSEQDLRSAIEAFGGACFELALSPGSALT